MPTRDAGPPRGEQAASFRLPVLAGLVHLDLVQGKPELGGALFAVLLAELVFLPFELHHLLMCRLQQMIAPDRIVVRVFRHDPSPHFGGVIPIESRTPQKGSVPQDCGIMTTRGPCVFDAHHLQWKKDAARLSSGRSLHCFSLRPVQYDEIANLGGPLQGVDSMSKESVTSDLFDRWELVWHEDRHDLVPSCVGPTYIRHEATGDRTVTAESYAAELAKMKEARPGIRVGGGVRSHVHRRPRVVSVHV